MGSFTDANDRPMEAIEAGREAEEDRLRDRELNQAMRERDEAEEMADKLADAIAELTGCAIGEHSSGNCPWQNALYAAEEMGPINPAQMLNIVEHASQLEVDYTAEDDMEIIEGFDRLRELLRPWRAERQPAVSGENGK